MLAMILLWYELGLRALESGVSFARVTSMACLEDIGRMKYVPENEWERSAAETEKELRREFAELR